jgi:hypothetical protein
MTTSSGNPDESQWLLQPAEAEEVQFSIAVGEGVRLTDDVIDAVETLLSSFQTQDVQGYAKCFPQCGSLRSCGTFTCNGLNNCSQLTRWPCAMELKCEIKRMM